MATNYKKKLTQLTHTDPDVKLDLANARMILNRTCDQIIAYMLESIRRIEERT